MLLQQQTVAVRNIRKIPIYVITLQYLPKRTATKDANKSNEPTYAV